MGKVSRQSDRYNMHTTVEEPAQKKGNPRLGAFLAKILALLGALAVWFYAASNDTTVSEVVFTVPVSIENTARIEQENGWSVISGSNNFVEVTLSGKKNAINKLTEEEVEAYADVGAVTSAGRHQLDVTVVAPGELTVVNQSVHSISVYVDKKMSVTVPVRVRLVDYLIDADHHLEEPVPSVDEVVITGPSSEVERIEAAQLTVSPGTIRQPLTASGTLVPVDGDGNAVTGSYLSMKTTEATVYIGLYTEKKVPLTVVSQYGFLDETNSMISVEPSEITLRGEPAQLSSLNEIRVAVIDEKSLTGQTSTFSAFIKTPAGVTIEEGGDTATVTVTQIGTVTETYLVNPEDILVVNPKKIAYSLPQDSLILTLRGNPFRLSLLGTDNVHVSIDLTNIVGAEGSTVSVPAEITFSDPVDGFVYEIGDYKVRVKLGG